VGRSVQDADAGGHRADAERVARLQLAAQASSTRRRARASAASGRMVMRPGSTIDADRFQALEDLQQLAAVEVDDGNPLFAPGLGRDDSQAVFGDLQDQQGLVWRPRAR
jgi:hypothetical protein